MNYEQLIEKLVIHFTGQKYSEEVMRAKRDFFEQAGVMNDEAYLFEMRMSQFLDWYIFSRELFSEHVTPAQFASERFPFDLLEEEKDFFKNLLRVRHSVFEFIKVRGSDIYVEDLLVGKKIVLKNSCVTIGFSRDELFEARFIPCHNTFLFTKGFCFHPAEAKSYILKEIKKVKHLDAVEHEALMFKLLKMRYKHEQYKHIRIEYIYTNDKKLRI